MTEAALLNITLLVVVVSAFKSIHSSHNVLPGLLILSTVILLTGHFGKRSFCWVCHFVNWSFSQQDILFQHQSWMGLLGQAFCAPSRNQLQLVFVSFKNCVSNEWPKLPCWISLYSSSSYLLSNQFILIHSSHNYLRGRLILSTVILSTGHFANRSFCWLVIFPTWHLGNLSIFRVILTSHFVNWSTGHFPNNTSFEFGIF